MGAWVLFKPDKSTDYVNGGPTGNNCSLGGFFVACCDTLSLGRSDPRLHFDKSHGLKTLCNGDLLSNMKMKLQWEAWQEKSQNLNCISFFRNTIPFQPSAWLIKERCIFCKQRGWLRINRGSTFQGSFSGLVHTGSTKQVHTAVCANKVKHQNRQNVTSNHFFWLLWYQNYCGHLSNQVTPPVYVPHGLRTLREEPETPTEWKSENVTDPPTHGGLLMLKAKKSIEYSSLFAPYYGP